MWLCRIYQSPSPKGEGTGIENCHSRSDTVLAAQGFWRRKDFGGAGGEAWEGAQRGKVGGRAGQGIRRAVVCLSVCLLRVELVRAALANRHEIFGGGQGHGQERLSPEPAQSVKVGVRKRREIPIFGHFTP